MIVLLTSPLFITILVMVSLLILFHYIYKKDTQNVETEATRRARKLLKDDSLGQAPDQNKAVEAARKNRVSAVDSLAGRIGRSRMFSEDHDGVEFIKWLDIKLIQAGWDVKYTAEQALAVALSIWTIGVGGALVLMFIMPELPIILYITIIIISIIYPPVKLLRAVGERQDSIKSDIPFFINNLYMSLSTGMISIDQAIIRTARSAEEDPYDSVLSEEFARARVEYSIGEKTFEEAIREIGDRTGVSSVSNLCEAIIQGNRTGTDLAEVLKNYSAQAQEMWRQDMRVYKSKKIPVVTLWMVLTMFGAVIIFATPFVQSLMQSFSSV